jgi:hypothetical protein
MYLESFGPPEGLPVSIKIFSPSGIEIKIESPCPTSIKCIASSPGVAAGDFPEEVAHADRLQRIRKIRERKGIFIFANLKNCIFIIIATFYK